MDNQNGLADAGQNTVRKSPWGGLTLEILSNSKTSGGSVNNNDESSVGAWYQ